MKAREYVLKFLNVYCDQTDCIFQQQGWCSTTGIEIKNLICETYEKEELPDYENPDKERV